MLKLLAAMVISLSTSGATCLFPFLPLLSLIGMPATLEVARSAGGQAAGKVRCQGARDEEEEIGEEAERQLPVALRRDAGLHPSLEGQPVDLLLTALRTVLALTMPPGPPLDWHQYSMQRLRSLQMKPPCTGNKLMAVAVKITNKAVALVAVAAEVVVVLALLLAPK